MSLTETRKKQMTTFVLKCPDDSIFNLESDFRSFICDDKKHWTQRSVTAEGPMAGSQQPLWSFSSGDALDKRWAVIPLHLSSKQKLVQKFSGFGTNISQDIRKTIFKYKRAEKVGKARYFPHALQISSFQFLLNIKRCHGQEFPCSKGTLLPTQMRSLQVLCAFFFGNHGS